MLYSFQVTISENKKLTHLHVPALRRHEIKADGDGDRGQLPGVRVAGGPPDGRRAFIQYRPKPEELQKRLRSRHALQFVVEYDVDRKDKAGEIQVGNLISLPAYYCNMIF